jgi:hypothetical protein
MFMDEKARGKYSACGLRERLRKSYSAFMEGRSRRKMGIYWLLATVFLMTPLPVAALTMWLIWGDEIDLSLLILFELFLIAFSILLYFELANGLMFEED